MKKLFILLLIFSALQACGSFNSENRGMDQGWSGDTGGIPPSYAHPAGGTMETKP